MARKKKKKGILEKQGAELAKNGVVNLGGLGGVNVDHHFRL